MVARTYESFDVLVEAIDDITFRARVTCAAGDVRSQTFSLPFSAIELENLLLKVDPTRTTTRRVLSPRARASADLGAGLFDAVFHDDILLAWTRSLQMAHERNHGLRLRLRLTDAPALAGLPWELLYDKRSNHYVAKSDRTPVVRYLDVSNPPQPLEVDGPLRILVIVSSPDDLARLDVEHEWARIRDVLADRAAAGQVVLDTLPEASLGELQKWLRRHEVHVLHFIGHGDFDQTTQEGVLAFCDATGRSLQVSSEQLGKYVRDHDAMRLVVLNACQTATTDNMDVYSGVAQGLIQQEAPAVVAMQHPISDGAAIAFTGGLYGALADGEPLDQAISSVRKTLADDFGDEWATPVLFLRATDGRIFQNITEGAPAPVSAATAASSAAAPAASSAATPAATSSAATPPSDAVSYPRTGPTDPGRRRRLTAWLAAAVAALLVAVIAVLVSARGGSPPKHAHGGSSTTQQSSKPRHTPSSRVVTTTQVVSPSGGGGGNGGGGNGGDGGQSVSASPRITGDTAPSYSGPSSNAYASTGPVAPGTEVALVCALYAGNGPNGDYLWYYTSDFHWINDQYIDTGNTRDPVKPACAGTASNPSVGTGSPSASTGPFAVLGTDEPVYEAPDGATQISMLTGDSLVSIVCKMTGPSVDAAPGGVTSTDWDKLTEGTWIPDAYLLSSGPSGSPADPCPPGS